MLHSLNPELSSTISGEGAMPFKNIIVFAFASISCLCCSILACDKKDDQPYTQINTQINFV